MSAVTGKRKEMQNMKNWKRGLSALLVLLMCVSLFPVSAFADADADLADAAELTESAEPVSTPDGGGRTG